MTRESVYLAMTEQQLAVLKTHLFPNDGCEAAAVALCGRGAWEGRHRLIVQRIEPIAYELCSVRRPDQVTWPTELLVPLLEEAERKGWAIVKFHGHRGYDRFSEVDDDSDRRLFRSLYGWFSDDAPHASAIVLDTGRVFGRVVTAKGDFNLLERVSVTGDDIAFHYAENRNAPDIPKFGMRVAQAFGEETYRRLRRLRVAVVGCSGTGSPVIEQLARNSVGELVLVDPDHVEDKNLNRIYNATMQDARDATPKVLVAKRAIEAMGMGTKVYVFPTTLFDRGTAQAVASADVVFGCMDTIDGRFLLNKLASFYSVPYIDLGVKIEADGSGGVNQVCGTVHYLKPGGSSLLSRHVFSMEQVQAAGLQRTNPTEYQRLLDDGYIRGVQEERPAVIQLNSLIASIAINELLARIHPYRLDPNSEFAATRVSLYHGFLEHEAEGTSCAILARHIGRGDVEPFLDWPELSKV